MSVEQATPITTPAVAPITAEQLWEMPETPGMQVELVRGEIVAMPETGVRHGAIALLLIRLLDAFVTERDLGLVYADSVGYVLFRQPDTMRIPDVSYVAWNRVPAEGEPEGYWFIVPDLAVEVVSPNDRADAVHEKVGEYLAAGTRLVWILWPKARTVTVYTGNGTARELGVDETLDGGEMLPGFSVPVAALFAVRRTRAE